MKTPENDSRETLSGDTQSRFVALQKRIGTRAIPVSVMRFVLDAKEPVQDAVCLCAHALVREVTRTMLAPISVRFAYAEKLLESGVPRPIKAAVGHMVWTAVTSQDYGDGVTEFARAMTPDRPQIGPANGFDVLTIADAPGGSDVRVRFESGDERRVAIPLNGDEFCRSIDRILTCTVVPTLKPNAASRFAMLRDFADEKFPPDFGELLLWEIEVRPVLLESKDVVRDALMRTPRLADFACRKAKEDVSVLARRLAPGPNG